MAHQSKNQQPSLKRKIQLVLNSIDCLGVRSQYIIFSEEANVGTAIYLFLSLSMPYFCLYILDTIHFNAAADVMLWRNKKISGSVLGSATVLWLLFEWLNYHFLTLICFALVLVMLAQFLWTNASERFSRYVCNLHYSHFLSCISW